MESREEALRRLAANHPRVAPEVLRTLLDALAREVTGGRMAWRADPLHQTRAPMPFIAAGFQAVARRVQCPVLFVSGGEHGWHPADEADRLASFARLERVEITGAGHMMHWTRPDEMARAIVTFALASAPG